jgi:hypothetical protein
MCKSEQHVEVFGRNVSQGFVHGVNWNHFEPLEFQAFPENIEDVFIVIREKNALFHFSSIFVCTVAGRVVTYNPITYWGTQSGAT